MPSFLYVGDTDRIWPDRRFKPDGQDQTVHPGDTVEADSNPDSAWFDEVTGDGALNPTPHAPVDSPADAPTEEA